MEAVASAGKVAAQRQSAPPARGATLQRKCACGGETHGGAECESCRKKRLAALQRSSRNGSSLDAVPPVVYDVLREPGTPLDAGTRATMESKFGHDFSSVRLHSNGAASRAAAATDAHAFTVGEHVVFGSEQLAPREPGGQRLLAHELAHVVQQRRATAADAELAISADQRAEAAADAAATRVMSGAPAGNVGSTHVHAAQREEKKSWVRSVTSKALSVAESGAETVAIKSIAGAAGTMNSTAGRLVEAMLWGMLDEFKVQSSERGAQAWGKVKEAAASPFTFLTHYWWGLVKGIFSPITGLFDLAKLAVKLQAMQAQLMASAWKNRAVIAEEAGKFAVTLNRLEASGKMALAGLLVHPIDTVKALDGWLTTLGKEAEDKARGGGHTAMKALLSTLDKPMPELAETAGHIVGEVLINIVLLVFTEGIGNAITQIATKLGELGAFLGKFGEAAAMIGKVIGELGELLGTVGGWVTKAESVIAKAAESVLKPVAPLMKELENAVSGLRSFLRRVLGVAEKETTAGLETAAGGAAKQLESHVPTSTPPVKTPTATAPTKAPTTTTTPTTVAKPTTTAKATEEGAEALTTRGATKANAPSDVPPASVAPSESKVFEGISKETEATLSQRPGLAKALSEHPKAADLFKLCQSECFPSFLTDEQMVERLLRLERMQAEAERFGLQLNRGSVKKLLHEQETVAEVDAALESIENGLQDSIRASSHPTSPRAAEPDVHVPPDQPPAYVEPRARGYAIEDMHMSTLRNQGYNQTPDWFKSIDAYRGGETRWIRENGKLIEEVVRPDVVSVKSTQVTNPKALTDKVTGDLDVLRGRFTAQKGDLRISGAAERRLDLIFEEGSNVTRETVDTLAELQRAAGGIKLNWWAYRYGYKVPAAEFIAKFL